MGKVGGQVIVGVSAFLVLAWVVVLCLPYWQIKHQQNLLQNGFKQKHKFAPTTYTAGLTSITVIKNTGEADETVSTQSFRLFQNTYCNDPAQKLFWGQGNCERIDTGEKASMLLLMAGASALLMMVVSDVLLTIYWTKDPKPQLRVWGALLQAVAAGTITLATGAYGALTADMFDFTTDIAMLGWAAGMGNGEGMNFGYCFVVAVVLCVVSIVVAILCYTVMGTHSMEFSYHKEEAAPVVSGDNYGAVGPMYSEQPMAYDPHSLPIAPYGAPQAAPAYNPYGGF